METPLYIAASRQRVLEQQMDVTAHNIANANTPAFKAERMVFHEYLIEAQRGAPALSFVQDFGQYRVMLDGPIERTGNPLDVAINGEGFFVVETPTGERYTRHGRFQVDADGFLATVDGYRVLGDGGPIQLPPNQAAISISGDGTISTEEAELGRLQLVNFEDVQALRRAANGHYATDQQPENVADRSLVQGSLEGSNVEPVLAMTEMIRISNAHRSIRQLIQQEDERQREMIRGLGRDGVA